MLTLHKPYQLSNKEVKAARELEQQLQQREDAFTTAVQHVQDYFSITRKELLLETVRGQDAPLPRHFLVWFLREELNWRWKDISNKTYKHRATLINSHKRAEIALKVYPELIDLAREIKQDLYTHA